MSPTTPHDPTLLHWIDAGGIERGMHVDDETGAPLCGRYPMTGLDRASRPQGHYAPHVLVTGQRETLGQWKERMGHTVTICKRCLAKVRDER